MIKTYSDFASSFIFPSMIPDWSAFAFTAAVDVDGSFLARRGGSNGETILTWAIRRRPEKKRRDEVGLPKTCECICCIKVKFLFEVP